MGFSTQTGKTITQSWGLGGQLLVLFLHDHDTQNSNNNNTQNYIPTKPKSLPFPSSSPPSSTITGRAQTTISICFFLLLISLSLFAISSFDSSPQTHQISLPRRWLGQKKHRPNNLTKSHNQNFALQGMGTTFHRGNRAMTELLVAHLDDSTRPDDLRWFVRTLLRSGLVSKSDVVLIFPQLTPHLKSIIFQENQLFSRFLARQSFPNRTHDSGVSFNATHLSKKPRTEPVWGRGGGWKKGDDEAELSRGSLVGFDSTELDPEDSLGGFMEKAPIQFRRWACYRMLLGRVRRSFKHVVFVGVKDSWVAGDVFGRVRNRRTGDTVWVSDHVIIGGIRAVRRLSDAMLTEIVRVLIGRKNRAQQQESQILNHLLKNNNSALSKKIKVSFTAENFPTNSILSSNSSLFAALKKAICDSLVDSDSSVYRDC